ncbi:MAG: hypothetical protein R3F43_12845 [bacterium]
MARADWTQTLELGVGVRGSLGGSYTASPDVLPRPSRARVEPVPYEGWWGFGGGGGLSLEAPSSAGWASSWGP